MAISATLKTKLRFWLGMAISVASLALAVRNLDLSEATNILAKTDYGLVLLALATVAVTLAAKAFRWKLLFHPHYPQIRFRSAFSALLVGQMVNTIFPLRLGEIARAYMIGETEATSRVFALGTVGVEKVIEMLMAVLLFALLIPAMSLPGWARASGETLTVTLVLVLLVTFILAYRKKSLIAIYKQLSARFLFLSRRAPSQRITVILDSMDVLRHGKKWPSLGVLSVIAWGSAVLTNYFTLLALGVFLPLVASAFLLLVLQIGVAVPSAPGKIGVFQYITILGLSVFSVAQAPALSVGILLYLLVYVPPVIAALLILWSRNLSLINLRNIAERGRTGSK